MRAHSLGTPEAKSSSSYLGHLTGRGWAAGGAVALSPGGRWPSAGPIQRSRSRPAPWPRRSAALPAGARGAVVRSAGGPRRGVGATRRPESQGRRTSRDWAAPSDPDWDFECRRRVWAAVQRRTADQGSGGACVSRGDAQPLPPRPGGSEGRRSQRRGGNPGRIWSGLQSGRGLAKRGDQGQCGRGSRCRGWRCRVPTRPRLRSA